MTFHFEQVLTESNIDWKISQPKNRKTKWSQTQNRANIIIDHKNVRYGVTTGDQFRVSIQFPFTEDSKRPIKCSRYVKVKVFSELQVVKVPATIFNKKIQFQLSNIIVLCCQASFVNPSHVNGCHKNWTLKQLRECDCLHMASVRSLFECIAFNADIKI